MRKRSTTIHAENEEDFKKVNYSINIEQMVKLEKETMQTHSTIKERRSKLSEKIEESSSLEDYNLLSSINNEFKVKLLKIIINER